MAGSRNRPSAVSSAQVESVMRASRALVGIAAASVAAVDDVVTVSQLRVLTMISTRGPMNLASVATGLSVSAPNASRICDRLLKAGLIDRRDDPADRRHITLTLTRDGRALVERVNTHRRNEIKRILRAMTSDDRDNLAGALEVFATAAGEPPDERHMALI